MAKRITSLLLVILLLAGIMPCVYATEEATDGEEAIVLASTRGTVTVTVDRNRQIQWIGHSDAKLNLSYKDAQGVTRGGYMTAVNVTKVDGVIAYCIEPCVEFGTKYTEDESIAAWMTQLTANQRSAIALAMAYGYPNTDHPAASSPGVAGDSSLEYPLRTDLWQISERYAATQIIIWEIVTGKRSAVAPYTCTDSSLYTSFYSTNNPYGYRADWNTLRDTYKRISDSMAAHKSVPSFSSSNLSTAPTYELTYNVATGKYETTLTDTNGVLSGYNFQCSVSGVTISRSGNNLKITATADAAAKLNGVTVSAAGSMLDIDPEKVVAVWAAEGAGQTAVTLKSSPDPVTAYFKLKAEATTEVKIIKTTNTGKNLSGWQINLYTDAACTKKVSGSPFTTGADGTITVDGLTPGTYYAKEVPSTDPYWVSDTSVKTVKAEAGKTATVTFSNTHYGDLRVKKNAINGPASGWKFEIYDSTGKLVETITTGSDGYAYSKKLLPGKYTIKEIHDKDDTYWIYDAQVEKQAQVTAGNQAQVEYTNEQVGILEIVKTTNTGSNLGGWKINLYTDSGCTQKVNGSPFTTGDDGKITVPDLKPGTYYAQEVASTDPYWVSDSETKTVKVEAGKTASVTFKNTHYGDLKVKKNAINGPASGWKFEIYDANGNLVETITTGSDGYAYSKKLLPGKYTVKEIHDKDDTYWIYDAQVEKQVQVTAGNQAQVEYTNEQIGRLELVKTTNTGNNLSGWQINLYTDAGCTQKVAGSPFTTGEDGKIIVPELTPGTYYAQEVPSTDPYWVSDSETKTVKVEAGKTASVTFKNTHYGDLRVKKNAINGSAAGWKFEIYDANGTLVETITTGSDGYAYSKKLLPGKYTVKEIHDKDDTYWTYDAEVQKQTQVTAGNQSQVEYTNEQFGLLEFRKTTNTQNHLAGWTFRVTDKDGKLVGEYTTDNSGYACTGKLKPGRYYVQEVGKDDPYWICDVENYPIDVTAGKTVGHSATNIELGKGTFHKTTNTGANLDGWEITVYEDSSCNKPISVITTDAKGYGKLFLEPGTYYARETGDTKGRFEDEYWEIDTSVQEFKIEAHKDTAVTFTNTHYGKGKVIKTLDTDGSLEGWHFKITDASGSEIEGSPFTTDKHGNILTGNLLPGVYTVEELIPEDSLYYCKTQNPQTITIVEGKTVSVTFTNALRPGKIAIEKVNTKGEHLAGATFLLEWSQDGTSWKPVVYSSNPDVVLGGCSNAAVKDGCLTTGKDGIAEWGNLYPGIRYRITEVAAPEGYILLEGYAFEGELPVEDLTVSLTVVNSTEFEMPSTGSNGMITVPLAVLIAGCAMSTVIFYIPRKEEE